MTILTNVPVLGAWVLPASVAATAAVLALLWWRRGRRLRPRTVAALVAAALAAPLLAAFAVDVAWRPFAEPVGWATWVWLAPITLAGLLALARPRSGRAGGDVPVGGRVGAGGDVPVGGRVRAGRMVPGIVADGVAVGVVALAATLSVNAAFGAYPTLGDLLGLTSTGISLDTVAAPAAGAASAAGPAAPVSPTMGARLAADQPDLVGRAIGVVGTAHIPATASGFRAREAIVYLPPAAISADSPQLPVLVLLAGQPGGPTDWIRKGGLRATMDGFAAAHDGRAPIVVVPDPLGSPVRNPLCSDTSHGDAAGYLEQDVASWLDANFGRAPRPAYRAIGGISNGGTCALQVGTRRPEAWPVVVDLAGELHPDLGGLDRTVALGFSGDRAAFEANDPLTLLHAATTAADGRYAHSHAFFGVGSEDAEFGPAAATLAEAAQAAGMDTTVQHAAGGHQWQTWAALLPGALTWYETILETTP